MRAAHEEVTLRLWKLKYFVRILANFIVKIATLNKSKGAACCVFLAQPSPAYGKLFFPISITVLRVPINLQGQCWLICVLVLPDIEA